MATSDFSNVQLRKYVGKILQIETKEERRTEISRIPDLYRGWVQLLVMKIFAEIHVTKPEVNEAAVALAEYKKKKGIK